MKRMLQSLITVFLLTVTAAQAHADETHPRGIKLDGSIGNAGKLDLPGPDYDIRAEYGHQAGSNLFHSFQQFNVHENESTTFPARTRFGTSSPVSPEEMPHGLMAGSVRPSPERICTC